MRPYFMRQLSTTWFNGYLIVSGVALNLFALLSIFNLLFSPSADPEAARRQRARVELEDARMCTRHMSGREFTKAGSTDFRLRLYDGSDIGLRYSPRSTYGHTKEGLAIEMVGVEFAPEAPNASTILFFLVNDEKRIERCLPAFTYPAQRSQQLDCLAAAGDYEESGDCRLAVNQPSDCAMMNGKLEEGLCRVPPTGRILRPVRRAASTSGRVCHTGKARGC